MHSSFSAAASSVFHSGDKNYFMEMNFRHDGLAYTATVAGINLLDFYVKNKEVPEGSVRKTYKMDISTDPLNIRNSKISRMQWFRDLLRTGCQLNFNLRYLRPTVEYYCKKFF